MRKRIALTVAAFTALFLVLGYGVSANASQSTYPWDSADIKNQSLLSVDLAPNSVGSSEIKTNAVGPGEVSGLGSYDILNGSLTGLDVKDKSLTTKDLSDATIASLKGSGDKGEKGDDGDQGPQGEPGADGKDGVVDPIYLTTESKTVTNMGGSWGSLAAPRATLLGSVEVPAGKYMIDANGFFTADADGNPVDAQVQTAVRYADGTTWGKDLGTAFATTGTWKGRDYTTSSTRVLTLPATTVEVYAFGYDVAGESGQNSGQFTAHAYLTLTPVQD